MNTVSTEAFNNVMEYLQTRYSLTLDQIASELAKHVSSPQVTKSSLSQYKSGRNVTEPIVIALQKAYGINPNYLYELSHIMLENEASHFEKKFSSIFPEWETMTKNYTDENGKEHCKRYLHVTMAKHEYDLLTNYDSAKLLLPEYATAFEAECKHYNQLFIDAQMPTIIKQKYLLIPYNDFLDILYSEERSRRALEEVLPFEQYKFFEDEIHKKHPNFNKLSKHEKIQKLKLSRNNSSCQNSD